jgi:predicted RNase H-like HicB family nuclease
MTMARDLAYYLSLEYPVSIRRLPDGQYCAEIPLLKGCCGYGQTADEALSELEGVKETVLATWLEKGWLIPEPVVRLEMPERLFDRLPNKEELLSFVLSD